MESGASSGGAAGRRPRPAARPVAHRGGRYTARGAGMAGACMSRYPVGSREPGGGAVPDGDRSAGRPAGGRQPEPCWRHRVPAVTMRELLEAGVHFGHQTRRWNPKMRRFIFSERGGIYIIDLQQTIRLVETAHDFARNLAERGGSMLFVGTKKQSQDAVAEHAKRVAMPYVNQRWLGGLLTNWRTIANRIERL